MTTQSETCDRTTDADRFRDIAGLLAAGSLRLRRRAALCSEIATLQRMSVKELRDRYTGTFGEITNTNNRTWLIKRIAWRLQTMAEGGLTERVRRRARDTNKCAKPTNLTRSRSDAC